MKTQKSKALLNSVPPETPVKRTTLKMEPLEIPELSEILDDETLPIEAQIKNVQVHMKDMEKKFKAYKEKYQRNVKKQQDLEQAMESRKAHAEEIMTHYLMGTGKKLPLATRKYLESFLDGKTTDQHQRELARLRAKLRKVEDEIRELSSRQMEQDKRQRRDRNKEKRHLRADLTKNDLKLAKLLNDNGQMRQEIKDTVKLRIRLVREVNQQTAAIRGTQRQIQCEVEEANECYEEKYLYEKKVAAIEEKINMVEDLHKAAMNDAEIELANIKNTNRYYHIKLDDRTVQKFREFPKIHRGQEVLNLRADEQVLQYYDTALEGVKEMAQNNNITAICKKFMDNNRDHHRLYNAILLFDEEIERMENERDEMVYIMQLDTQGMLKKRQTMHQELEEVEKGRVNTAFDCEGLILTLKKEQSTIKTVEEIVTDMFKKLNLKKSRSLQNTLLGPAMSDHTVEKYMSLLEVRCRNLVYAYKYYQSLDKKDGAEKRFFLQARKSRIPKALLKKKTMAGYMGSLRDEDTGPCMDTECAWDEEGDDEHDDEKTRILSREELYEKARKAQEDGSLPRKKLPKKQQYLTYSKGSIRNC